MIVDFHSHPEYKNLNEKYTAEEFISGMDVGGIDVSCVYGCDQGDAGNCPPWREKDLMKVATNIYDEELAAFCKNYPERLIGITSIHPDRYLPERKVERAIKDFGMKGVKLYPHAGFYANDARLIETYKLCSDLNIPVIIHSGPKANRWQWLKYNNPLYVDEVATKFPYLKIVVCHGGHPWTEELIVLAYTNPNVWIDLTWMEGIEETFLLDNYVENTIKRLVKIIGANRLLWGSEGPYMNLPLYGKHDPKFYAISQYRLVKRFDFLTAQEKADILGNNAAELLGL